MRSIIRLDLLPPTLKPAGEGGKQASNNLAAHVAIPPGTKSFKDHWNEPDVRGVLYAMQWRVCAYCGRNLPGNDRGDVEHYRPKKKVTGDIEHGGYWWLAYELDNYVLSCRTCNSSRKRNKFPLRPGAGRRVTFENKANLKREARLLLHPVDDPLDDWISVDWELNDSDLVQIGPRSGLTNTQTLQINESLKFFRVNMDQHLVKERLEVLDQVSEALENREFSKATNLAVRYSPQSIVARAILKDVNPGLLPSSDYELRWLLTRISEEIDRLTEIIERFDDQRSKLEYKETLWMLAALLANPPNGNDQLVRNQCIEHGVLEAVEELVAKFG